MKVYIDGKLVDSKDAKISVFDHGLLYGDGVFEGIRVYNGRIFMLEEHIERLYNSARAITLQIPMEKGKLIQETIKTVRVNGLRDAYIRLIVTRGVGDLGLDPKKCERPTVIIIVDKIKLYPEEFYKKGLEVVTVSTRRNSSDVLSPLIKSLNYLNNILAKIEATRVGVPEAIMLNRDGYVAECTGDNIFIIKDETLLTPPTWAGVLDGITRRVAMDLARKKLRLNVKEEIFTTYHIYTADECFLTGTGAEIIPVVKVDQREISNGIPGPKTTMLIKEFRKLVRTTGVPVFE